MSRFHDQAAFEDRLPVAFAESHDDGDEERSISAVGLILIAFVCLKAGALMAFFGGFGILMSLLIGWASSFVGLFAVIACIMLTEGLFGRDRRDAGMSEDIEMEKLRARWNQSVAMAQLGQHGAVGGERH